MIIHSSNDKNTAIQSRKPFDKKYIKKNVTSSNKCNPPENNSRHSSFFPIDEWIQASHSQRVPSNLTMADTDSVELNDEINSWSDRSLSMEDNRSDIILSVLGVNDDEERKENNQSELEVYACGPDVNAQKSTNRYIKNDMSAEKKRKTSRVPTIRKNITEYFSPYAQDQKTVINKINSDYKRSQKQKNTNSSVVNSHYEKPKFSPGLSESENILIANNKQNISIGSSQVLNRSVNKQSNVDKNGDSCKSDTLSDKIDQSKNQNNYRFVRSKGEGDFVIVRDNKNFKMKPEPNRKGVVLKVNNRNYQMRSTKKREFEKFNITQSLEQDAPLSLSLKNKMNNEDNSKHADDTIKDQFSALKNSADKSDLSIMNNQFSDPVSNHFLNKEVSASEAESIPEMVLTVSKPEGVACYTKKKKSNKIFKMFKNFLKQSKLTADSSKITIPLPTISLDEESKPVKFDVPLTFDLPRGKIIMGKLESSLHFTLAPSNECNNFYNLEVEIDHNSLKIPIKSACNNCLSDVK